MSQCWDLLSWRATRPIYHLYLKAFNLIYETFFCKPCPRTFKGGVRSPAPKTALPQTSLGPRDWRKGARRPRYQEGKKKRKPVLYHKEEEGCRSICVFLPGILLIICGIPNDERWTCGMHASASAWRRHTSLGYIMLDKSIDWSMMARGYGQYCYLCTGFQDPEILGLKDP